MADFSFSFDSDNPFAESEQTPKKASVSTDETSAPAHEASVAAPPVINAPVMTPDESLLDSFDFAFDEGSSINDTLPTRTTPLDEEVPRKPTPGEAAFAAFNFSSLEGYDTPAAKAPAEADAVEEPAALELDAPTEPETPLESEAAETETPEAELPEVEMPAELEIPAQFDEIEPTALEMETPVEPEIAAELEAPAKNSTKSATSDLEEFNALAFDFGPANDAMFADASDSAGDNAGESEEVVDEVAPFAEAPVAPTESLDASEEEPVDSEFAAENMFAEEPLEISDAESPVEELEVAPLAEFDTDFEVPHAVVAVGALEAFDGIAQGQTEGEFRRLKTKSVLNVAILGASGIGKNHARWFHRHGCRIAGFLGTSADSIAQTEANLSNDFDFQGTAYTDLETLLQSEKPDIVCVATPPPLHFGHVLQSLEAGAHVLCEKPLVYAPTRKFRENRDGAKELVKVAAKKNLNLGTQLQYGAATPILCKLAGLSPHDVGDFAMELETANPNSPRDPRELWIDLGPHPISVAQILAGPDAHLAEETLRFEPYQDDDKTEVLARFGINCADGRLLMVRAVMRALHGEISRKPRRRFSFNGHAITYAPLVNAKGDFQAQFIAPDGYSSVYSDPVDYLIGDFVNSCRNGKAPLITGDFGRENLEWMLKVGAPGEAR